MEIPAIANNTIRSDTGEITRDFGRGVLSVDTPRIAVRSGFIQEKNEMLGKAFTLSTENAHLSATVVSGDDKDLAAARTVYVLFGVNAANTGEDHGEKMHDFNIGKPYPSDGSAPIMADALSASVSWKRPHNGYRVYAEDPSKAEYKLIKQESTKGGALAFDCLKNAYRYKIVFE